MNNLSWIANTDSMIVHCTSCDYASWIAPWNEERFDTLYDALGQGFQECGYCLSETPMIFAYGYEPLRAHRAENGCLICGSTRAVQMAHVLPKATGCKTTIELCANHHWAYDSGQLTKKELRKLEKNCQERHGAQISDLIHDGHGAVRQPIGAVA